MQQKESKMDKIDSRSKPQYSQNLSELIPGEIEINPI